MLAPVVLAAPQLSGQSTLPSGASVRITLTDRRVLDGRLIRADSSAFTLAGSDTISISRDQISALSLRKSKTATYARRAGRASIIPAAALGALAVAIGAGEDRPVDWNPGTVVAVAASGLAIGAIGTSIGAIVGAVTGAFVHEWTPVALPVRVTMLSPVGPYGIETCGNGPMIHGEVGKAINGGPSARFALALTCTGRVTGGAELGSLGRKRDGTSETFAGAFTELALGDVPLNPRLVASLGAYHETQPGAANVVRWRPGAGLGMAMAAPVWRHLSTGAEARLHLSGNGSAWFTVGLSGRYRP